MELPSIFETEGIEQGRDFNEILTEVLKNSKAEKENLFPDIAPAIPLQYSPDTGTKGFRLYQLTELLNRCNSLIEMEAEENEGVYSDNLAAELDALEMAKKEKVLAIAKLIKNKQVEINAFDEAIKKMTSRKKKRDNDIQRLMNYLSCNLTQDEVYEDTEAIIKWKKNTGTEIIDVKLIPDELCKFEISLDHRPEFIALLDEINKKIEGGARIEIEKSPMIRDRIAPKFKKGEEIPGIIKKTGKHLIIE
jgi:hypothetical protein